MAYEELFDRLAASKFRSSFKLTKKDKEYVAQKGMDVVRKHAEDFVAKRLAPAFIANDGKQTPTKGHPVFKAQHACGCCCRGCLFKWHRIKSGKELSCEEQGYIVDVLMTWIERQMSGFVMPKKDENDKDEEYIQLSFCDLFVK